MPLLVMKNAVGFVILLVVPLVCVVGWYAMRSVSRPAVAEPLQTEAIAKRCDGRIALALTAFLISPIAMAIIGFLWESGMESHPADQGPIIAAFTTLGLIAGTVVALAVAVSAAFD
jgi:hypothetical protein